jgi:hypothetical protein
MLVGGVLSAVLGSGRGDDNGVDRALEAGENAGARAEGMMGLRGCGASVCVICEGWDVRHESGERLVGRDDDAIAPHSSGPVRSISRDIMKRYTTHTWRTGPQR